MRYHDLRLHSRLLSRLQVRLRMALLLRVRSGLRLWTLLILLHFGGLLVLLCLRYLLVGL